MATTRPWDVPDGLWDLIEPLLPTVTRRFRYPGRKRLGPLLGEGADSRAAGQHAFPRARDITAEGAGGAHPGDHDSGATHVQT